MPSTRERHSGERDDDRSHPLRPRPLGRLSPGRQHLDRRRPHLLRDQARGNRGACRRIRFGQVGFGQFDPEAAALSVREPPERRDRLQRQGPVEGRRCGAAQRARQRHHHDLPGADDLAQPAAFDRAADRRDPRTAPAARRSRCAHPHSRASQSGRYPRAGEAPQRLSARALRWPAPARHERHGACQPARALDRRRADNGARRHGAGADPRASEDAQGRARHVDAVHHPRPRHRAQDRRPGLRDDQGQDRRDRPDRRDLRQSAARLYPPSARLRTEGQPAAVRRVEAARVGSLRHEGLVPDQGRLSAQGGRPR
ncbi:hypothetical protein D9M70_462660 [compost metagenome]